MKDWNDRKAKYKENHRIMEDLMYLRALTRVPQMDVAKAMGVAQAYLSAQEKICEDSGVDAPITDGFLRRYADGLKKAMRDNAALINECSLRVAPILSGEDKVARR